jgi:hypothetical protein
LHRLDGLSVPRQGRTRNITIFAGRMRPMVYDRSAIAGAWLRLYCQASSFKALIMETLRNAIQTIQWKRITALPHVRSLAVVLMIVLPGGFIVPACYAAYVALRHAGSR